MTDEREKGEDILRSLIHSAEQAAEASQQMAHIFVSYYKALKKAGAPDELAIPIVLDFQHHLLSGGSSE